MFVLAKLPIPFVIYYHPLPWAFLVLAAVVVWAGLRRFYEDGPIDPTIGGCGGVFVYAGYHMTGGFLHGMDPFFYMGFVGCAGSAACAAAMLRSNYHESVQLEADEPARRERQRQEGAHNLVTSLGCTQTQALELMDLYGNDDVRAIMEVRSGRQNVSGGVPLVAADPRGQIQAGAALPVVSGSPFDPVNGFAVLQAVPQSKSYAQLAKLLSSVTTLNLHDASHQLRNHRGALIIPNLSEAACEAFMLALEQDGQAVVKLPMSQMLRFRFCGEVRSLQYGEDGLTVTGVSEAGLVKVGWDKMLLLSLGVMNATMVPDLQGYVDFRKGLLAADLFVLSGDECLQFAFDIKRLNYAHLGSRMETTAMANFRLTVADFVERAPQLKNAGVEALLERSMARSYKTPEDFAGESTGLLQLVQARRLVLGP